MRCFFFGSLMDRDVAALVLDRSIDTGQLQAGILHGYERLVVAGETYPALAPRAGGKVSGLLMDEISAADIARMQFFESSEFAPAACDIELVSGGYVSAQTFLARAELEYSDQPWDYPHWQRHDKRDYLVLVREWMSEYGRSEAYQLEAEWSGARRAQIRRHQAAGEQHEQHTSGGKIHE